MDGYEHLNAFVPGGVVRIEGRPDGRLTRRTFAAKDLFDIAGMITGCGNPTWAETNGPAAAHAPAVQALLDAGATLVGKTHTDELAFSLNGENFHYGTPVNAACPDRIPGGSSSGSASAVSGGACDMALGTDTGGSVRAPASYCGLYGIRPSHGRIPLDWIMPLAPSFDTVGWFTRDVDLLIDVARVFLSPLELPERPPRLLAVADALDLVDDEARAGFEDAMARLAADGIETGEVRVLRGGLDAWLLHFRVLQMREIWNTHGAWIEQAKPTFGPGIAERFQAASQVTDAAVAAGLAFRQEVAAVLDTLLEGGDLLVMPTVPGAAPRRNRPTAEIESYRNRALSMLCLAGLCRLPQVSLPLLRAEGCPVGLSLIARHGDDAAVLGAGRMATQALR